MEGALEGDRDRGVPHHGGGVLHELALDVDRVLGDQALAQDLAERAAHAVRELQAPPLPVEQGVQVAALPRAPALGPRVPLERGVPERELDRLGAGVREHRQVGPPGARLQPLRERPAEQDGGTRAQYRAPLKA